MQKTVNRHTGKQDCSPLAAQAPGRCSFMSSPPCRREELPESLTGLFVLAWLG